jgi:hypothetical protein
VKNSTPPAKSEDPTPPQGVRIPPGAITPAATPELSDKDLADLHLAVDNRDVESIAQDLASAVALKEKVRTLLADLESVKKIAVEQEAEITTLRVKLAGLEQDSGMTEEDVKALFAMCAEITFDRTRNGEAFVISLKGRRSHTQGKVGRFGNFPALLSALRARKQ